VSTVVAFDESGNTGDNLLDARQRIHALASIALAESDAQAVVGTPGRACAELKYSELRATEEGQAEVLNLLRGNVITPENARVTPTHKPYAVVARYFDYLMETTLFEGRFDVQEAGFHISFANILYRRGPAACGGTRWKRLLEAFVGACRRPSNVSFDVYAYAHLQCREACSDQTVAQLLDLVPLTREGLAGRLAIDQGDGIGARDLLDPAATMLLENCMYWPEQLGRIIVRHDESHVIRRWTEKLMVLAGPSAQESVGHYWAERMPLPLRIDGVELVRSHDYVQVQLADVLAGAAVTWLGQFAGRREPRDFIAELGDTILPDLIQNEIWPLSLVDGDRF
jgi:hypothetical protein